MKRTVLAAGAAALALSLPATAALADGYEPRRPAAVKAKPKPKPVVKKVVRKHAPKKKHKVVRHHAPVYVAKHVSYEEFESVETSVYEERNGYTYGPVVSYSERYIAPAKGCYPHAPCGYSTGVPPHAVGYGMSHGGMAYGHPTSVGPGFHHGPLTGGVGYGVDGGPVWSGGNVYIHRGGFGGYSRSGSSYRSHSSASSQAYGHAGVSVQGGVGHGYGHGGYGRPAYGHGMGHGQTVYGHGPYNYSGYTGWGVNGSPRR